jgi:hypothetical protein
METLLKIWPFIERFGVPIIAIVGGVSFFSINFYFQSIGKLRHLENYYISKSSLKGFKPKNIYFIGFYELKYSFKRLSKLDSNFTKYKSVRDQVSYIRMYCKYYKLVFPIIIILVITGNIINEFIIDSCI